MKHGHISRQLVTALFSLVTVGVLAACTDQTMAPAPAAEAPAVYIPANFAQVGGNHVFRVTNADGITKKIGTHVISIPANAICELTSGYGPGFWDQPCQPLRGSVVITARVMQDPDGQPYIDFQPAMRFAPNKDVMLFMREGRSNGKKQIAVKFCDNLGFCIDEALTDPSLQWFRVGKTPIIGRRVKHFSGYTVTMASDCTGTATPIGDGTFMCEDGGFQRRSGYMVASGEDIVDVMKNGTTDKQDDEM